MTDNEKLEIAREVVEKMFADLEKEEANRPFEKDGRPNIVWQNPIWQKVITCNYIVRASDGKKYSVEEYDHLKKFEVVKLTQGGKKRTRFMIIEYEKTLHS